MPDAQTSFTQDIPRSIASDVDKARAVDAVFLFKVNGDGGGDRLMIFLQGGGACGPTNCDAVETAGSGGVPAGP